ncbi:DUF2945 domain-containing protein [Eleftheria terrae]|uniref:DUF2945 domain-containing protein n=1 Tax=Eleftheria terrae TaxID=1597781 RepID=UPI00263BE602|nr:DUF2945 domain-containing protein [Eleftheria terrae]WKB51619.1 DUF2945 domain-containing protein [Eleftheria terrae]
MNRKKQTPPPLHAGDKVSWQTPQGRTAGTVVKRVTRPAQAGGHTAQASSEDPQYEVRSEKSGKTAIHRPQALHKR